MVKAYSELQHEGVIEIKHGKGVFVAEAGRPLSAGAMRQALCRLASQLAVEGSQMGADRETVVQVLQEEWDRLGREKEKPRGGRDTNE